MGPGHRQMPMFTLALRGGALQSVPSRPLFHLRWPSPHTHVTLLFHPIPMRSVLSLAQSPASPLPRSSPSPSSSPLPQPAANHFPPSPPRLSPQPNASFPHRFCRAGRLRLQRWRRAARPAWLAWRGEGQHGPWRAATGAARGDTAARGLAFGSLPAPAPHWSFCLPASLVLDSHWLKGRPSPGRGPH